MTLSVMAVLLCCVSLMLSATYKHPKLSAITLNVIVLSVIMLSVMAPS